MEQTDYGYERIPPEQTKRAAASEAEKKNLHGALLNSVCINVILPFFSAYRLAAVAAGRRAVQHEGQIRGEWCAKNNKSEGKGAIMHYSDPETYFFSLDVNKGAPPNLGLRVEPSSQQQQHFRNEQTLSRGCCCFFNLGGEDF